MLWRVDGSHSWLLGEFACYLLVGDESLQGAEIPELEMADFRLGRVFEQDRLTLMETSFSLCVNMSK